MKTLNLFSFATAVALTFSSCSKTPGCTDSTANNYNLEAEENDGSCTYSGTMSFWTSTESHGAIDIYIDGVFKGSLTSFFNSQPTCDAVGTLTFQGDVDSYNYSAIAQDNTEWEGTFEVTANECFSLAFN